MSTPVSRKTLDLDLYRRMRERASSGGSMTSPPSALSSRSSSKQKREMTTPSSSGASKSSSPTPKKVMTWKQLQATMTPEETRALQRRPKTPNENDPMNSEKKTRGRTARRDLAVDTTTRTPKSLRQQRRQQRVSQKAHLLGDRGSAGKTPPPSSGATKTLERLTLAASTTSSHVVDYFETPRAESRSTRHTPGSSSTVFETPQSSSMLPTSASSATASGATSRGRPSSLPITLLSSPPLHSTSAFMTPTASTPTTIATPSTMDRSRSASVDLRRNASVERWRSAGRLYACATSTSTQRRSRSASSPRNGCTARRGAAHTATTPEPPHSRSTATLQSAAKLYARATAPSVPAIETTTSTHCNSKNDTTKLWSSKRRSRSIQKARNAMGRKERPKTPEFRRSNDRRSRTLTPPRGRNSNTPSGGSTRRNLDKRTARLMHGTTFASNIVKHRQQSASPRPVHALTILERGTEEYGGVSVVVRKRPIFEYETQGGDFDVVFTEARSNRRDAVVVYSTMMHPDMRQMLVKPHAFTCSAAFDEDCTNDDMYQSVGQPLVERVINGGMATLLMFGQTGTGKTHTMTGMEERMAMSLFDLLSMAPSTTDAHVTAQFVELSGKQCRDLLEGGDVRVAEHANGSVKLMNAARMQVMSAQELCELICHGKKQRATESTGCNSVSSRSHAICQITVASQDGETTRRGVLTLLDCAGTERRNDSALHCRDRQKESAEINSSLWALKECIRARAAVDKSKRTHVPYRSSNLTRILRETLERDDALLCVVATVAPGATNTEHTLETLRTVSKLVGMDGALEDGKAHVVSNSPTKEEGPLTPKQWNHSQLVDFLKRKRLFVNDVPGHMDGRFVMRLSPIQLKNLLYDNREHTDKGDILFKSLRAENDRVSRILIKRRLATSRGHGPLPK